MLSSFVFAFAVIVAQTLAKLRLYDESYLVMVEVAIPWPLIISTLFWCGYHFIIGVLVSFSAGAAAGSMCVSVHSFGKKWGTEDADSKSNSSWERVGSARL